MIQKKNKVENPTVLLKTNMGNIKIALYPEKAPKTVKNFKKYINNDFYDNTIFHRIIPNFVIQAGGIKKNLDQKQTYKPIENEADNGLENKRGTIAMARTDKIDSATSHFFINLKHNKRLDHKNKTKSGYGYCVFGKVIEGMKVVDKIANLETETVKKDNYKVSDVPKKNVIIKDVIYKE
ncbi:MAG: peptidyl-prolyl cis-trans isomerase [Candidatus Mcinerneyibacterium aminivorans]|uniref:Peptidyl-prolyl cis-trans isomerase n=1 Tax=Candidatus Mcinerneyibacterium aminivorans TaxID=2703815 RepID=A0A5D0MMJ7_9BACT|nr:MAG: peptidyl-prolyl cis-trans isomerase [Candidatus Mcinerneyibacterium aminivorans]